MAGDQQHDRIVAQSRADGALCPFVSRFQGEVGVGGEAAARNLEQGVPDLQLKVGSLQVEPDFVGFAPVLPEDRQGVLLIPVGKPSVGGVRKGTFQPFERLLLAFVREGHVADAFFGRADDDRAEQRFGERIVDRKRRPAVFVFAGCHAFDPDEQIVQAARRRQTDFVCGVEKRGMGLLQYLFRMLHAQIPGELLRRYADPLAEQPLEMERAQVHVIRHIVQPGLKGVVSDQKPDGRGDALAVYLLLDFHGRGV